MLTIISNSLILVIAPAIPMMAMTTAKRPRDTPNPARAFTRLPILKDPMEMFSSNGIYCAAYAPPFSFIIAPPISNEMPAIYKLIKYYFKNIIMKMEFNRKMYCVSNNNMPKICEGNLPKRKCWWQREKPSRHGLKDSSWRILLYPGQCNKLSNRRPKH